MVAGFLGNGKQQQSQRRLHTSGSGNTISQPGQQQQRDATRLLTQIVLLVVFCFTTLLWMRSDPSSNGAFLLLTDGGSNDAGSDDDDNVETSRLRSTSSSKGNGGGGGGDAVGWNRQHPLGIPEGGAPNLPSVLVHDETVDTKRKMYGGAGDKGHLGGFTEIDTEGLSPAVWKHMVKSYGIRSVLDVGCGRGISTSWFHLHGLDTMCVEGSHDAVQRSMIPDPSKHVVEHDFARGPWWPEKTYDAVWAVEFLEHVSVHYQFNYLTAFRKAAIIFATSSTWGGWHHVEIHSDQWWIRKMKMYGFEFDEELTSEVRKIAHDESHSQIPGFQGKNFRGAHIIRTMKVFINPVVSALPEHAHLFPEYGCVGGKDKTTGKFIHEKCGREGTVQTPSNPKFYPWDLTEAMDKEWFDLVNSQITPKEPKTKATKE